LNKLIGLLFLLICAVILAQSYEPLLSRPDITGLTGGTATDLDGIATKGLAIGTNVIINDGTESRIYRLTAWTAEVETEPTIILPDDFGAGNQKVWITTISSDPEEVGYTPTADNDWTISTAIGDGVNDTTLVSSGEWGIFRAGNTAYGNVCSTHVDLGVACTTGMSTFNYRFCTVGGGIENTAGGARSTVCGGGYNTTSYMYATIGGGYNNIASEYATTIGGGFSNLASDKYATVAGGEFNVASGIRSTVAGGECDTASGGFSAIGGGYANVASDSFVTIAGGRENTASKDYATIGGGYSNQAHENYITISGGSTNFADKPFTTIGGGVNNWATGDFATVGGGDGNTAGSEAATVAGGNANMANLRYSVVGGGESNIADGFHSTISGGADNNTTASYSTVSGGFYNLASGEASIVGGGYQNTASGQYSAIPGGYADTVSGAYSFAFGRRAVVATDYTARFFSAAFPGSLLVGGDVHISGDLYVDGSIPTDGDWTRNSRYLYAANASDSVIIGGTTPISLLTVETLSYNDGITIIRSGSIENQMEIFTASIKMQRGDASNANLQLITSNTGAWGANGGNIWLEPDGISNFMVVKRNRTVGIDAGVNPLAKLHVSGGDIFLDDGNSYIGSDATNADSFWIYDDGTQTIFDADNEIKIGDVSLIVETDGDVVASQGLYIGTVPDDATQDSILTIDGGQVKKVAATDLGTGAREIIIPAHEIDISINPGPFPAPQKTAINDRSPVLSFDPLADEFIIFSFRVPEDWDGTSNVEMWILWSGANAGAAGNETVRWEPGYDGVAVDEDINSGWAGIGGDYTMSATANGLVESYMGNINAAGKEFVNVRFMRNADFASDDYSVDARLHMIMIRYNAAY